MTGHIIPPRSAARRTGGFTLVELLVTITIIAILTGISLVALNSARQTARIHKTRTTIEKINTILMDRYESYRTRRLPVTQTDLDNMAASTTYSSYPAGVERESRIRLDLLRDLMRMEMPDRWSDVLNDPSDPSFAVTDPDWRPNILLPSAATPSLTLQYYRKYQSVWTSANNETVQRLASPECLYMIVMSDPEAASQFHASEIGDTDNDGLPEFLDAWGRPIRFIRWPAGFVPNLNADTDLQVANCNTHHDPFDPNKVDVDLSDPAATGYALYPLAYSAGPDGKYDINEGNYTSAGGTPDKFAFPPGVPIDPYVGALNYPLGQPLHLDEDNPAASPTVTDLRHYDNIHNHRLEGR